jgi:hypothetical protein
MSQCIPSTTIIIKKVCTIKKREKQREREIKSPYHLVARNRSQGLLGLASVKP